MPTGDFSDCHLQLGIPLLSTDGKVVRKEEVNVRYQQFTEFSTYTFVVKAPTVSGEWQENDSAWRGSAGANYFIERGESLVRGLKNCSSWWRDIPGEIFLVAVVAIAPETIPS